MSKASPWQSSCQDQPKRTYSPDHVSKTFFVEILKQRRRWRGGGFFWIFLHFSRIRGGFRTEPSAASRNSALHIIYVDKSLLWRTNLGPEGSHILCVKEHLVFHNFRYIFIGFPSLSVSCRKRSSFLLLGPGGFFDFIRFLFFFSTRQPRSTSLPWDRGCQTEPWWHSAFEDGFGQMIMLFCMVCKRLLALFENWYTVFSENRAWHVSLH